MRVGIDGLLLAANDAAQGLLGASELGQVLGSALTTWIVPEHHELWREFASTVAGSAPGSVECEVRNLADVHRTVLFHGVPLLDHQDGIPSMMLTARDTSTSCRLETALQGHSLSRPEPAADKVAHQGQIERARDTQDRLEELLKEGRRHLLDLRTQLEGALADRCHLEALLEERGSAHQRLVAEQAAERTQLQQTLAEQHQLGLAKQQDTQQQLDGLRIQLDAAVAERTQLQQTLAEQHQLGLAKEQETQQQLDALQTRLETTVTGQHRLETLVEEREAAHARLIAEQAQRHDTLMEQHQIDFLLKEQEAQQQLNVLRAQLEGAAAEGQRLEHLLEESHTAHQQFGVERETERFELERALEAAALKQNQLAKALADYLVELQGMELAMSQLVPLAASGRMAVDVGQELSTIVAVIDARAARILERCSLEDTCRPEVEGLRGDAIRARSLTHQILHVTTDASAVTARPDGSSDSNQSSLPGEPA